MIYNIQNPSSPVLVGGNATNAAYDPYGVVFPVMMCMYVAKAGIH